MTKCVHAKGDYYEKLDQARNLHIPPDLHIQKHMGCPSYPQKIRSYS